MSTPYEAHMQHLKDKFGLPAGRLQTDPAPAPLSVPRQETARSRHEREHIQGFKDKYRLPHGLEIEGLSKPKEPTLAEFVEDKQREATKLAKLKLSVGRTIYQGKPLRLWYDISF